MAAKPRKATPRQNGRGSGPRLPAALLAELGVQSSAGKPRHKHAKTATAAAPRPRPRAKVVAVAEDYGPNSDDQDRKRLAWYERKLKIKRTETVSAEFRANGLEELFESLTDDVATVPGKQNRRR